MQDDTEQTQVHRRRRPAQDTQRDALRDAIAREELVFAKLQAEQAESRHRLAALRAELAALDAEPEIHVRMTLALEAPIPRTPADKVRLFRSLFRGREDIFPTRFVSAKTGKSGYAPACRNKFVRGVCELPKVKCGDCPNQAFIPFDDAAVIGHLTGRHVMGVYPLLADETCWFLAVDFDKSTWIEDVGAFVETCRRVGLPAAVERSRSGNGAHVWFFFSSPVPAAAARKMGCYLITETMSRRHELSMESYDRLFPSQDTMPRGGFGNLIALPLQHGPRALGNSVFLDDQLRPYPDDQQWSYLASLPRIDVATVELIAREATDRGSVVGVQIATSDEEDTDALGAAALAQTQSARYHRAAPEGSARGARAEALCRQDGPAIAADQPDQAPGRLSESRVLQEAEHASLDGHDTESHRMRRRSAAICRSAARLPSRARGAAARLRGFRRD